MADLSWISALTNQGGGGGSGGVSDYDQLTNRPVINIAGTGIVISSLATGVYNIEGTWKITDDDVERETLADDLFYVMNDGTEEDFTVGQMHYCPMGKGHTLINKGETDLVFIAIVSEHHD